ncbi:hypothetical protein ACFPT7_09655 [Acidicapsa dinghuensis]|uniref:Uncharacterized protein n=1 Tax=Acidicapsa dinghuensis TaxID=2218256 RepID=A0ABW1EEY7_9BACT|nr:hypothetical protein [Acidicapsa dinghuensis]
MPGIGLWDINSRLPNKPLCPAAKAAIPFAPRNRIVRREESISFRMLVECFKQKNSLRSIAEAQRQFAMQS